MLELGESDNGRRVAAKVGDVLTVRLAENASTGYRWSFDKLDPTRIELLETAASYPDAMPGSGGEAIFKLRIVKPGSTDLTTKYWRAWEGERSVLRRFTVRIIASR